MDKILYLIDLFSKDNYFLLFLVIMMILILIIIIYLIKLQVNDNSKYKEEEKKDEEELEEVMRMHSKANFAKRDINTLESEVKELESQVSTFKKDDKEEDINPIQREKIKVEPVLNREENIEEPKIDTIENEEIKKPLKIEQESFNFDKQEEDNIIASALEGINNYEDEQEANAIISTSELEKKLNDLKLSGNLEKHEEEINSYEEEQETKAIISYDELIKRAARAKVSYESSENIGGIKVDKVDTKVFDGDAELTPYKREEEFLKALKEFRRVL